MDTAPRQLLFACDFEERSLAARDALAALAPALHASVLLVHVQLSRWESWLSSGLLDRQRQDRLETWAEWLRERGVEARAEVVLSSEAASALATVADREQVYAIVCADAEYPEGKGRFEDRTVENLARLAHQPVWVHKTRQDRPHLPRRILCGVDPSEPSREALRLAVELAAQLGAAVDVVQAVSHPEVSLLGASPQEGERVHEEHKRRAEEQLRQRVVGSGLSPSAAQVQWGHAADVLLARARDEDVDLVVLGPGRGGALKRLVLGSTAGRVLYEAPTSVLLIGEGQLERPAADPPR